MCDSEDRDFRDNEFIENPVEAEPADEILVSVKYPEAGFRAFYVDLIYKDLNGGLYSKSTRMFVANPEKIP